MKIFLRIIELLIIFIGFPLFYYVNIISFPIILPLLIIFVLIILLRDKTFKCFQLWNFKGISKNLNLIVLRFIALMIPLVIIMIVVDPQNLFIFPKTQPYMWLILMVLYPIFSAYPQELIYRTFFFKRYQCLFPNKNIMVFMSTICFSFLHIIFRNPIALIFAFLGGYIFARTYQRSRSLILVTIEHTLYGCWVFTIGLGVYFFIWF